jgi:nucleoside-diphosphate-sugar epimerase
VSRVLVTGGAGKAGRAVVRDLLSTGTTVLSIEKARRLLDYESAFAWRDAIGRAS